jgi:hypothetical protein
MCYSSMQIQVLLLATTCKLKPEQLILERNHVRRSTGMSQVFNDLVVSARSWLFADSVLADPFDQTRWRECHTSFDCDDDNVCTSPLLSLSRHFSEYVNMHESRDGGDALCRARNVAVSVVVGHEDERKGRVNCQTVKEPRSQSSTHIYQRTCRRSKPMHYPTVGHLEASLARGSMTVNFLYMF